MRKKSNIFFLERDDLVNKIFFITYFATAAFFILLPKSYELQFKYYKGNIVLFYPEIILLSLIFFKCIYSNWKNKFLIRLFILLFALGFFSIIYNRSFFSLSFYSLLSMLYPLLGVAFIHFTINVRKLCFFLTLVLFILLGIQLILYSTGVLHFETETGKDIGETFDAISRIRTTAGPATATGITFFLCLIILFFSIKLSPLYMTILSTICLLFCVITLSRGPILSSFIFLVGLIAILIIQKKTLGQLLRMTLLILMTIIVITYLIYFSLLRKSIEERFIQAETSDYGRITRIEDALRVASENMMTGVSPGMYVAIERFRPLIYFPTIGHSSPHNVYLLLLVECGIIFLFVFIIGIIIVLKNSLRSYGLIPTLVLFLLVTISLNTEIIIIQVPWNFLFYLTLALATASNPYSTKTKKSSERLKFRKGRRMSTIAR